MLSTTEEALERLFNQATGKESAVERVKKIRDYAFVHFRDRDDCLLAQQVVNGMCFLLQSCLDFLPQILLMPILGSTFI